MMRKAIAVFALTSAGLLGQAPDQSLNQGERDRALSALHGSRRMLLDAVGGLSAAQWKFKPAPEAWSAAEIVEHLAVTEEMILGRVEGPMMESPAQEVNRTEAAKRDQMVLANVPVRDQKFQAPDGLRPAGRYKDGKGALEAFKASRETTRAFVERTPLALRAHAVPHPALGPLDAYQWILLIAAHTERHVAQIAEVKAAASFPRK
jgi:hypothetical protein